MTGYLAMQRALASDEAHAAMTAAVAMQKSVEAVDMSLFDPAGHKWWMQVLEPLKTGLAKVADTHDLKIQREGLDAISRQVIALSRGLGPIGMDKVFVLHCPMAFDNRGADWVQDVNKVANPYFGKSMPQCGTVEQVIGMATPKN